MGFRAYTDLESLSAAAAELIAAGVRARLAAGAAFTVALAGGSTPRRTYELLAEQHGNDLAWERVDVYFGDERCVPPQDAESNFALAYDALLSRVLIPAANVHPMYDGHSDPETAAARYEMLLGDRFGASVDGATFDLAVLGVGDDGHTASLFPGSDSLEVRDRRALAVDAPPSATTRQRITLTLPALAASRCVVFLCA
ncbi:MAG: 6-phosphogluconolactonase, partial [Gemmatimonadota bacterium]|nr:6-phosphogluconolactonase [Gemmatimonadota bacterium]